MKLLKKLVTVALIATMIFVLGACGKKDDKKETADTTKLGDNTETTTPEATPEPTKEAKEEKPAADTYELALITDVGTIDDKSFNQGAWEGVEAYAKDNGLTYKYYQPTGKSDDEYLVAIDMAIKGGAKVVVCPGFLFEVPIHTAQTKYPDVNFVILDGAPHAGDYVPDIAKNTYSILYAEEQAGFLAGYAIVKEGYTKLGFMGGMAVPAVVRYGYGFVQGADYAAKELGLADDAVQVKYTYFGNFDPTPENMAKAASWYNEGTEVIFACAGGAGNSVMKAAETAGTKVIGVDVDQANESDTVITSSMKNLSKSVYDALTDYYNNAFPGGTSAILSATEEGVQLPMATSRFEKFTQADYDAIYKKIEAGEIPLKKDTDVKEATEIEAPKVVVELIK